MIQPLIKNLLLLDLMNKLETDKAVLILEDGSFLEGLAIGCKGTAIGEVVFNTGITGYQEVLTDPSYFGQLITFTYPEIGNTGVNSDDQESSSSSVRGLIVRQLSARSSNWRSKDTLNNWLKSQKVVGISGIDTRALVRHLREYGSMNGVISTEIDLSPKELLERLKKAPNIKGLNMAKKVSTKTQYKWNSLCNVSFDKRIKERRKTPFKVAAIDFGIKKSILNRLVAHGCEIVVLPFDSDLSTILELKPDGIFLSNGPGDPAAVIEGINLAKNLIEKVNLPIFGICLGHQILGLALGGKTFKLNYGHRGLNHPCGKAGRLEITSQNHGFALQADSLPKELVKVTHFNLNDKTVAGIAMLNKPVFGVQYHPEASPGPHDADHHFERFVSLMGESRSTVV